MFILFEQKIVLTDARKIGGLWCVNPPGPIDQTLFSLSTLQTSPSLPSINCTITFSANYTMNVLGSRGILKDILTFYHGAFSFPTFSTICKSIYKHHLISLPGNVTYKQVRKHLTFSKPIHQRHLLQEP